MKCSYLCCRYTAIQRYRRPVPILGEDADDSDQLVTQVITVVNVPAAQLVPILRPMVPQQGHLAAYAATNSLIITDRASNIQRLMEIIRRIDRPDNEEIEVVRLNHASATEIVRTLSSLQRNNIGGPQGPGAMQLVADERTNSVLISGDRAVRVRIRGLIAHLDTPIESGGNTRVVYLKFANAEDMVTILQGVSQGQAKVGATTTDGTGGAVQQTFTQPQQPTAQQGANNQAIVRNNLNNNAVTPRSAAETGESSVDIQADPNTNSLIITAPPDEMQNILAVIRQLDIRRAQVLVEAVIAEITEDNTREFGINFLLDGTDKDVPIGYSNLGGGTDGLVGLAGAAAQNTLPSSLGAGLSLALGRFATGEIDFGFLVRAIASDADNNILSTPSIVTLDNEEAEIVVGSNVPFVTGQQLSSNNDNPFQTIERRDIGLTLKVKPQINDGNTIKMDLEQEVSNVNTTALTGAADITTSKRSIKTTVLVEDGQTLVLGGLIDDQFTDVEEKVPLLGDIPVLGRLFRYRNTRKNKKNLMIFLHPLIMRDSETAYQYSNSKYNFLRSRQMLYRQQKDNSIQKDHQELPELKLYMDGKNVDSPLTQFDSPGFESPTEPLRLSEIANADISAGTVVNAGGNTLATAASPAKADIEKVVAAYNAEQAEQLIADTPAATAPVKDSAILVTATETTPLQPAPETAVAETTGVSENEAVPELPNANAALVANILAPEPETESVAEVAAPVKTDPPVAAAADTTSADTKEQTPEPILVKFEETVIPSETDTPVETAATETAVSNETSSIETSSNEKTPLKRVVRAGKGKLVTASSAAKADIDEVVTGDSTEQTEQQIADAQPVTAPAKSTATELQITATAPVPDAPVDVAVSNETDATETSSDENDPLMSLPLATTLAESLSKTEKLIVAEVPASSTADEPIVVETAADGVIEIEDADALVNELAEDLINVTAGDLDSDSKIGNAIDEYVDNIDGEFVDRSQDELADDRPEVVILSISVDGTNQPPEARLPEMQLAPRY